MDALLARRRFLAAVILCASSAFAPLSAGTLSGRLLDGGGNPVAGARVSWSAYRDEAELDVDATSGVTPPALGQARTGSDGRFSATLDASGPAVSLRIESDGLPGVLLPGPFLPSVSLDVSDLELPAASFFRGTVVSPSGAGVAGARVVVRAERPSSYDAVFFAEALAAADGSFAIAAAPSGGRRVEVRAAGFAPFLHAVSPAAAAQRIQLEPGGVVAGTVTDAAGHPAPGAIVSSSGVAVLAGAAGQYRLAGVPAGQREVEATLGMDQMTEKDGLSVHDGAQIAADLRLAPASSIAGTVTDATSRKPIGGARVAAFAGAAGPGASPKRRTTTDASGRFRAGPLLPGRYAVRAERQGYLATSLAAVDVRAGGVGSAAIALAPAASVAGRVVDEKGKPVAGARVRIARGGGAGRAWRPGAAPGAARETVTGPDGTFRLEPLTRANGETLEASKSGYVSAERALTLASGQALTGVSLALRTGLSARGRVTDQQGAALAGAEVRVAPADERGGRRGFRGGPADNAPDATTGGDGAFVVSGLEQGAYRVTVTRDGYAPKTAPSLPVQAKAATVWPPIVLSRGAGVAGTVKDGAGHPVIGAGVGLFSDGGMLMTTTDASGAFRFDNLPPGRPGLLSVAALGFAPARRPATAPADGLAIVLGKDGTLRGRVADADTGDPIRDFSVSWYNRPPGGGGRGFGGGGGGPLAAGAGSQDVHSDDGTFEVEGVPPGTWTVTAAAPGYRPADVAGVEVAEAEVKEGVALGLHRGGTVTGRVTDAVTGGPVANASVSFAAAGASPGGGLASPAATTDADGRFTLDNLPAGKSTITASQPDYETASKDVDPSATPDVTIGLGRGAEITGAVVAGSGGAAPSGVTVQLTPEGDTGGPGSQTTQADSGGAFHFDHLSAGRYRLSAQSKTATAAPQELVLADGQNMDGVQVPLASGAQLDGTVSGLPAGKLGGVNVTATGNAYRATAVTGDDGKFTLQSVPSGVIRLTATTAILQGRSTAQTVEVPDDATELPVEIAFQGASRLSGLVSRSGKPLPGLTVAAVPDPPDGSGQRYSGMTDDAGQYALEGMSDGGFMVSVNGQGASYRKSLQVSGDTNGDIALTGLAVQGTITDSATGAPVEGAAVQAETGQESQLSSVKRAVTDSNGSYSLADVDPGSYQVTARKDGYQLKTQTASVDSQAVQLDFALDSGAGLRIRVTDGLSGMALGGVTVLAFGASGSIAFLGPVSLDGTGSGEIPSLAPGQYFVTLFAPSYSSRALPGVTVPADTVPVSMTPGGRVEARATSAVNGRLTDASGGSVLLSSARLDGSVTIAPPVTVWAHLAPGSYTLLLPSSNGELPFPFTVAEGQTTTVTLP